MKRWIVYLLLFAAAAALGTTSFTGTDVGELLPVEVVRISCRDEEILLETDNGNSGRGMDVTDALRDLKESAPGNLFLETADYLILVPGCEEYLEALYGCLRPSCGICLEDGKADMERVGEFLSAHKPETTLRNWRGGAENLPVLKTREGRMELVQGNHTGSAADGVDDGGGQRAAGGLRGESAMASGSAVSGNLRYCQLSGAALLR